MTLEYTLKHEDGEPVPCDSCNSRVPTSEFTWGPPFNQDHERPYRALCEFCSSTMASRHTEYQADTEFSALRAEIWKAAAASHNLLKFPT